MGNLIEQLGGYKKTKEYLKENSCFMSFEALEGFYDALLEYRRQHNILEEGDLVVKKSGKHWNQVFKVHNSNEKITTIQAHVLVMFETRFLRHATNEDIAAGRRL